MRLLTHPTFKICSKFFADYFPKATTHLAIVILVLLLTLSFSLFGQNALVPFTFKLNVGAKTSAGVYKKDGTLIRTLWGGVSYPAGTHTKTWDRKDDEGRLITDTGLLVKVLSNNVNYKWEGVIGNTSDSTHGSSVFKSYYRMESMAIYGGYAYYSTGYSEGSSAINKFALSKPQNKISIMYAQYGTSIAATHVATDGNYVYWAGSDPFGGQYSSTAQSSFAIATKVTDDAEVLFPSGSAVQCGAGRLYTKAIDVILNNSPKSNPTGMAVQKNGKYLFISHGGLDQINVLDKKSGAFIRSIAITNPRNLSMDANDDIWIISATNTVEKYVIDSTTGNISSTPTISLSGLLDPIGIAVSPNNYQVLVMDGDSSQQIKAFSNISGVALWTYGQAGGYATDPTVANDKFYFTDLVTEMKCRLIAFQSDSSFWVSDGGNERVQHYSTSLAFIDNIMHLPATYSTQVDRNDPTRAFNEFLEFKIDYSKPLAPNNGSWVLYKNWKHGVPATHRDKTFNAYIFQDVVTLGNGRTYATLYNATNPSIRYPEIVELPASGNARLTGIKFDSYSNEVIDTDGTRRIFRTRNTAGDSGYWEIKNLTGFDSYNNPVWGNWTKISTVGVRDIKDPNYYPYSGGISYPKKTSSDILVTFNNALNEGYHLGGLKVGDNKYLWKTAASTFKETSPNAGDGYLGEYPVDGSYEIGNNVQYGGGHVYTLEKSIFWNYHGEFWKGGQTNEWSHVYDNGLLISQFGITTQDARLSDWDAPAQLAGNVFASTVVKVGSDYYLYHNDEAEHSGLHRWKITGLNTIQEQTVPITFKTVSGGLTGAYFDGADLNNVNRKAALVDSVVNLKTPPAQISNPASFSAKWTGYVQPLYSQNYTFYTKASKGARLWIDGQLVINQWNNTTLTEYASAAIAMTAGSKYTIQMEINGGTAALSWSSTSQAKGIIPATCLLPSDIPVYANTGIDLMEGLPYRAIVEDGMYGWNRNPAQEDNTSGNQNWHVKTNVRSFEQENPDIFIKFRSDTKSSAVTRDLGKVIPCLTSWTITGKINYDGNEPNFANTTYGGYIDVLDNQGKVISRIANERLWNGKNPTSIKCNGTTIVEMPANAMAAITNKLQDFEITSDSSGILFKYGTYTPIKVSVFDAKCNWKQPAAIRFSFSSSSNFNYDKTIGVQKLRFTAIAPALPQITVSGPTAFCQGDSVTLTSSAANAYLWSNNATSQSINVKATGNYVVIVKDSKGCPLPSDTIAVNVHTLPVVTISANKPTTFCKGDSVTLNASNAATYLWNNNANTKSIVVTDAGSFYVKVSDAIGCTSLNSPPVQVNVNPLPVIPTVTVDKTTTFCMGDTITLTSSLANSYLWSNNATTQSIKVNSTGDYTVKTGDLNGCSSISPLIPVKVNIIPITKVTASGPLAFCEGESVTLTSSPAVSYLWSNNETTQSIIADATDDYMVVTKDANECFSISNMVAVKVNALPTIPSITGNGVILTSSSVSGNQWYFNDVAIAAATNQTYTATKNGKYRVEVSDGNCSSVSDPFLCNTVNIKEINDNHEILIFPNPSNGKFQIKNNTNEFTRIVIYNVLGEIIYQSDQLEMEIDLTNAKKGIYFIEFLIENQKINKKLVIE